MKSGTRHSRLIVTGWLLAALTLIELHGPQGQRYFVNPAMVTTIREPLATDQRHFVPGMRCVIVTSNGKFLPVHETCDEVRGLMERK